MREPSLIDLFPPITLLIPMLFIVTSQVTLALSPKEVKIVKCNGNNLQRNKKKHEVYALHPDYLSQSIVVIGVCNSLTYPVSQCHPTDFGLKALHKTFHQPNAKLSITKEQPSGG